MIVACTNIYIYVIMTINRRKNINDEKKKIIMKKGKIYILNNINRMRVRGSERIIINK